MKTLNIHSELQTLLPALSEKEYAGLEKDILERGCLSPIVTWNDTIVDGHNRYAICQKHGSPFEVKQLKFASLDDAKFWAWTHQENRRNLTPYQRIEIAEQFKPLLIAKAKARMSAGGSKKKQLTSNQEGLQTFATLTTGENEKTDTEMPTTPDSEKVNVREELAKIADVSHETMRKAAFVQEHADDETKEKLRQGKTSINKEYKRTKEKAADSKPKTTRTKKAKEKSPATVPQRESKTSEPSPSQNIPCINELVNVQATTLTNIRQDDPDHLLRNLATHFRKGFIADLILAGMNFLHVYEGEKVTTSLLKELNKRYSKTQS